MSEQKLAWSAAEIETKGFRFAHPLEEETEVTFHMLSRLAGLERASVNLVRVAPGRKAFPRHRHLAEEEWTYVLAGEAEVTLGDETIRLGPGGFVAFPPGGPAHQVVSAGETELVCLMGGENLSHDTVEFPDHKKRLTKSRDRVEIASDEDFEPFDFFSRTPLPMGTE